MVDLAPPAVSAARRWASAPGRGTGHSRRRVRQPHHLAGRRGRAPGRLRVDGRGHRGGVYHPGVRADVLRRRAGRARRLPRQRGGQLEIARRNGLAATHVGAERGSIVRVEASMKRRQEHPGFLLGAVACGVLSGCVAVGLVGGCTVGDGVGSANGKLQDIGCNNRQQPRGCSEPRPRSIRSFFAGNPIEDVCPPSSGKCSGTAHEPPRDPAAEQTGNQTELNRHALLRRAELVRGRALPARGGRRRRPAVGHARSDGCRRQPDPGAALGATGAPRTPTVARAIGRRRRGRRARRGMGASPSS